MKDLKDVIKAKRLDKNGKLFFDCAENEHPFAVLPDIHGGQFWTHYFCCGICFVKLSFFSHLVTTEVSLTNQTRNVTHDSLEYQWLMHELPANFLTA